jgi:hypothetical protein
MLLPQHVSVIQFVIMYPAKSMTYWPSVQVKMVCPSELFPYPKTLFALQTHSKFETEYTELSSVNGGVSQGSALGSLLHLLYTADLPASPESTTAAFTNDTVVVATHSDPTTALQKLQTNLFAIQNWFKK